jgi:hypothetical protein
MQQTSKGPASSEKSRMEGCCSHFAPDGESSCLYISVWSGDADLGTETHAGVYLRLPLSLLEQMETELSRFHVTRRQGGKD